MPYNRLLQRQIKRLFGAADEQALQAHLDRLSFSGDAAPAEEVPIQSNALLRFLSAVSDSYEQHQRDLDLSTRSLDLSSAELTQANDRLRAQAESLIGVFRELRSIANSLLLSLERAQLGDDEADLERLVSLMGELVREREENLKNIQLAKIAADEANRAKGDFLATMSHEIRTPLNAVIGLSDILGNTSLTAEQAPLVKTMESSGTQLLEIINDVLDFSRLQASGLELHYGAVELKTFMERLILMVGGLPNASKLDIQNSIDPAVPAQIIADDARLMQILTNLLGNAVKFTQAGEIRIRAFLETGNADQTYLKFSVADTGPGIPPELREQIFEPFKQGAAERLRPHAGSGLGLAICKRLAAAMNGSLELRADYYDGACFVLSLPLQTPAPEIDGGVIELIEPIKNKSLNILVAEDTPANQLVIQLMLEGMGHAVRLVENGQLAVDAWRAGDFEVVFLDIQMPVMDGYEAARTIRASGIAGSKVPIFALTAFTQNSDRVLAAESGITDFLSKPIRARDINQLLQKHQLGQQKTTGLDFSTEK